MQLQSCKRNISCLLFAVIRHHLVYYGLFAVGITNLMAGNLASKQEFGDFSYPFRRMYILVLLWGRTSLIYVHIGIEDGYGL